jgi:Zn-dependent protease
MTVFITVTILWVFSVCLHEFGHAIFAYRGGDTSVREKGYLSLNPIHYAHPVYSVVMPLVFLLLGGIGLPGGAVYIDESRLRSRSWRTAVALAGPGMNLILVQLLALPFQFGLVAAHPGNVVAISLAFLIQLEISSILLCLLPLPPLDGFRAIEPWLDPRMARTLLDASNYFLWGLFLLLWYVPAANGLFWGTVNLLTNALGIDPGLAYSGLREYQFWR